MNENMYEKTKNAALGLKAADDRGYAIKKYQTGMASEGYFCHCELHRKTTKILSFHDDGNGGGTYWHPLILKSDKRDKEEAELLSFAREWLKLYGFTYDFDANLEANEIHISDKVLAEMNDYAIIDKFTDQLAMAYQHVKDMNRKCRGKTLFVTKDSKKKEWFQIKHDFLDPRIIPHVLKNNPDAKFINEALMAPYRQVS